MLKDDLFIRSPKGMLPTPREEQLAVPVRLALDGLQQSLEPTQFDPSKAIRRFRIAVDNYSAVVLVGILAARIGKIAPKVLLEFQPSGTLEILDLLDRGELDLAIGPHSQPGERFSYRMLLEDEFVAVLRRSHSAASKRELAIEEFADLPHLEISSARHATDFIDEALAQRKLTRRIGLRAPFLCQGAGMPFMMIAFRPLEFVITPGTTYVLIADYDPLRRIFTDGREWPAEIEPTIQGYSIGK
jgi:DNA-binding transcriptional LysR family regulator